MVSRINKRWQNSHIKSFVVDKVVKVAKHYPTTAPFRSWNPPAGGPQISPGARRVWHVFLQSGYKFYYVLARSRYKLVGSTFESWCRKLDRSQWRSGRGRICLGARYLSRCRIYNMSR